MGTSLSERDTDQLLDGIAVLAEPLALEDLRHEAVHVVYRLIPCDSVSWNEISPDHGIEVVQIPETTVWPGVEEDFAQALSGHPVISHIRRTNDGRPRSISDFWTVEQFHESPAYRLFYARLAIEDQLSFTVPTPHVLIGIALNRGAVGFSPRDRTIANLLRPHILQAYRNAMAAQHIRVLMTVVDDLTSDRDAGLVMLDGVGDADHLTPAASALLSKWFPQDAQGRLPHVVEDWLHSLNEQSAPAPTWPLVFEDGGRRLVVRRLQFRPNRDGDVLHVSEHPTGSAGLDLTRLGLSARQADVVALAARGMTNAQIAIQLDLSVRTVEGHMSQALDRLGVKSRTAAASLVHQLELSDRAEPGSAV